VRRKANTKGTAAAAILKKAAAWCKFSNIHAIFFKPPPHRIGD